ncbi:hypothetical protein E4U21_000785 [Claviceps maximensis]|nr:hypothetical protein E4U21_000785 [Claviceps maximensis]
MAAGQETAQHEIHVPWGRLLTWVQQQIDFEAQTGHPVALSRLQLEALSHLISFNDEPDNAKQFAAKQALKFLSKDSVSVQPAPLGLDKRQLPPSPQAKSSRPKREHMPLATGLAPMPSLVASPVPSFPLPPPPQSPSTFPTANTNFAQGATATTGKKPSVFEQVAFVTGRLGIDSPNYSIEPDQAGADLFCGRPVFKNGGRVPINLGCVSGVKGQAQAKMRIAEEVLAWAEAELQRRQDIFQNLWGEATLQDTTTSEQV